jgi:hypothetical protein
MPPPHDKKMPYGTKRVPVANNEQSIFGMAGTQNRRSHPTVLPILGNEEKMIRF